MKFLCKALLVSLLVGGGVACSNVNEESELLPRGGLEGQMWLGPTCPVQRENDPACADRPYAGAAQVETLEGMVVAQVQADAEGRFKVRVRPGSYILVGKSAPVYPRGERIGVTVPQSGFAPVTLHFDTGIR